MNSLEFIEKEIEWLKKLIVKYENHLLDFPQANVKNRLEEIKKEMQILQQIKCELEAWEVVKDKSVDIHDVIHCSSLEVFNCCLYEQYQLTEEEYNKIKKALEAEDAN